MTRIHYCVSSDARLEYTSSITKKDKTHHEGPGGATGTGMDQAEPDAKWQMAGGGREPRPPIPTGWAGWACGTVDWWGRDRWVAGVERTRWEGNNEDNHLRIRQRTRLSY